MTPSQTIPTAIVSTSVLRADKDTLTPGECTTLRWDIANFQTEITRFVVSATKIKAGQTATISWDVTCAQGVFLKEGTGDSPRQPMRRHDTVDVQPDKTTVYRLIVIAKDGSEIRRDVTIEVEP